MVAAHAVQALAPVLGLAAYCLSHLAVCRAVRGRGAYLPLVIGCGCGLAVTVAVSVAALWQMRCALSDGLVLFSLNAVAYLALAFGYFNFVNLNIASLRIRMIQELAESGGRLPIDRLTGLYNTQNVAALRIDRLTRGGHLVEREGKYYSGKRRFLIVARIFDFLRWAILGQRQLPSPSGRGAGGEGVSHTFIRRQSLASNSPHPIPVPDREGTGVTAEHLHRLAP